MTRPDDIKLGDRFIMRDTELIVLRQPVDGKEPWGARNVRIWCSDPTGREGYVTFGPNAKIEVMPEYDQEPCAICGKPVPKSATPISGAYFCDESCEIAAAERAHENMLDRFYGGSSIGPQHDHRECGPMCDGPRWL